VKVVEGRGRGGLKISILAIFDVFSLPFT